MAASLDVRLRDSLGPAAVNAIINGAIAWATFRHQPAVPLTLDLISTSQPSVWGQGVSLTFGLGVVLTLISAKVFSRHVAKEHPDLLGRVDRPLFPDLLRLAFGNAMGLFGWFVALAVLWQRALGVLEVSPALAAALVGVMAGVITALVEVRTRRTLLAAR